MATEIPKEWNGCNNCKHRNGAKCPAFPESIPLIFLSGDAPHLEVVPGQVGKTVWELRKAPNGQR